MHTVRGTRSEPVISLAPAIWHLRLSAACCGWRRTIIGCRLGPGSEQGFPDNPCLFCLHHALLCLQLAGPHASSDRAGAQLEAVVSHAPCAIWHLARSAWFVPRGRWHMAQNSVRSTTPSAIAQRSSAWL